MRPPAMMFFGPRRGGKLHGLTLGERLWLARRMRWVARDIRKKGWTAVPFRLPEDRCDRFVYTVGFDETLDHPELILFDTPYELAVQEFYVAFEEVRSGKLTITDGMLWSENDPARCVARRLHPGRAAEGWLGLAEQRRRLVKGTSEGLEAFQLVLTDRSGVLPWEPGYDESVRQYQPALYQAAEEDFERES